MPFINLKTNVKLTPNDEVAIKSALGKLIEIIPGKSEDWLMIQLSGEQVMYFKGSCDKCAMIEVKIYGSASSSSLNQFTSEITSLISKMLSISPSRIYVSYFETSKWGYSGSNF